MFNRKKKDEPAEKPKTFDDIREENQELYKELTNKNKDYMFQLNSRLDELDYDTNKKEYVFNEMLHEIISAQEVHMPARKIYGTVTEQADNVLGKNVEMHEDEERSPTWQIYVDGALLMGGLFGIVNGVSAWNNPEAAVGLLQIIMNFLLGGLAILVLTKYMPKPGQSKGLLKYIGATAGVMLFWVLTLTFVLAAMPRVLNPAVPGPIILAISAIALIGRWLFKRKYNVKGSFF